LIRGNLLLDIQHPVYEHQRMLLYNLENYVWLIPYVETENEIFLKTLYPTRKYTKRYREGRMIRENKLEKDQAD
jgi:hypothetical protein